MAVFCRFLMNNTMDSTRSQTCFVLLPGFAPDNVPVLKLKELLEKRGYSAIATNFYGGRVVTDFSKIRIGECLQDISKIIAEAARTHSRVVGVGISLGGALLIEYAKTNSNLTGIISVGTPFQLHNRHLLRVATYVAPVIYPVWRRFELAHKEWRLPPIGATRAVVRYLEGTFLQNLDKVKTSTLFLHTKTDAVANYKVLPKFVPKFTGAKTKVVITENGSHVMDDNPEIVLRYIEEFLT